jgi:hypothetical protein
MASRKSAPKATQTQAERLLEVAKKAKADGNGNKFARATGSAALAKNARKATRFTY